MPGQIASSIVRADGDWRFIPEDAAAALIEVEGGGYLMQLRDDIPNLLFPGCWGCFGGALEPGETMLSGLRRELEEEIGLSFAAERLSYFTRVSYDFGCIGKGQIDRDYFRVRLTAREIDKLTLGEGHSMSVLAVDDIFGRIQISPFDQWAIWLSVNEDRLGQA